MRSKSMTVARRFIRSIGAAPLLAALIVPVACSTAEESEKNRGDAGSGGTRASGGSSGKGSGGSSGNAAGGSSGNAAGGSSGNAAGGSSGSAAGGSSGNAAGTAGIGGAAGAGGSAGTAGRGGAAGAAGTAGADGGLNGGYMTFGNWHGYAFTYASPGSTINPPNFGAVTQPPLCASGNLVAGTTNVAILGINLNQAATPPNAPALTVAPTLDGITVSVTNNGSAQLRLQIQGPNGHLNTPVGENDRWCAPISGSGGFIPWNAFNTRCWDGSGNPYNKEALVAAMILVPGAVGPVSFNFCLNNIAQTSSDGGTGGGGCTLSGGTGAPAGTIPNSEPLGRRAVNRNGANYVVQNNRWGGNGNHALSYSGVSFTITEQTGNNAGSPDPVSYPSVFIGSNNSWTTQGSTLPKLVSSLNTVQTAWTWSAGTSGTYNAAYDVWFSSGSGGDPGNPSGGYLMVWLHKPSDKQPVSFSGSSLGVASIAQSTWNVWIGERLGRPIISYVRTPNTNSMSFDLNLFIREAVGRTPRTIQDNWYLTNIFAGFEIWSGGVGLRTDNFCAVAN